MFIISSVVSLCVSLSTGRFIDSCLTKHHNVFTFSFPINRHATLLRINTKKKKEIKQNVSFYSDVLFSFLIIHFFYKWRLKHYNNKAYNYKNVLENLEMARDIIFSSSWSFIYIYIYTSTNLRQTCWMSE